MAVWIKGKKDKNGLLFFPECSHCGYHWHEEVIGTMGKGHSNLTDAKFCPSCGEKMIEIVQYENYTKSKGEK